MLGDLNSLKRMSTSKNGVVLGPDMRRFNKEMKSSKFILRSCGELKLVEGFWVIF